MDINDEKLLSVVWDRIKRHLDKLDISENEFAKKVGVPQPTINRIKNRAAVPGVDKLRKIAEGMDIPLAALVTPDETESLLIIEMSKLMQNEKIDLLKHAEMEKFWRQQKEREQKEAEEHRKSNQS